MKIGKGYKRKIDRIMQKKLVLLFCGSVLAFLVLIVRIAYINATKGDKYTKIVLDQQNYDSRVIPFKRGEIQDRNGTKLAKSTRVYNVILDVVEMKSDPKYEEPTIKVIKDCFGIPESDVKKAAEDNPESRYVILKKGIEYNEAKVFNEINDDPEKHPNILGVWLEEDYTRTYPFDTLASAVVGFSNSENQGSYGVEAYYNSVLNGTNGREYGYTNDTLFLNRTVMEPQAGKNLVLTIDLQAQQIVEKHLKAFNDEHKNEAYEGEGSLHAAAIVMNPQNGEIIAEAVYPNYNLNNPWDLSMYYSKEDLEKMKEEEKTEIMYGLWKNFCVSSTYEPGSTFKPFTVAAGLELGNLTGSESYYCGGVLRVGDDDIKCNNEDGHGTITLKQSVEYSCNVALMEIAAGMGVDSFLRYQKLFGFGQKTGIDLPGEENGILYTSETMDPASLGTNSFGQNFNVTMTQMASGFCSLINGGIYYRPHVVKEIRDSSGNLLESKTATIDRETISGEDSRVIKDYLLGVVTEGTGTMASVEGYDVGGKTGTAEKHPRGTGKHLLSFAGYAPQESPEVMIYVVLDEVNCDNQAYSGYVTQLSSDIMAELFPYLGITKAEE